MKLTHHFIVTHSTICNEPPKKNSALFALKCEPPLPCQNIISVLSNDSYDSTAPTNRSMSPWVVFFSPLAQRFISSNHFSPSSGISTLPQNLWISWGKIQNDPETKGKLARMTEKPCTSWGHTLKPLGMVAKWPLSQEMRRTLSPARQREAHLLQDPQEKQSPDWFWLTPGEAVSSTRH